MTHHRLPHHRRLRIERHEDRRLLSAAPVATPDVEADDTPTYLSITTPGWIDIDEDSQFASFDFSVVGTIDSTPPVEVDVARDTPITLGGSLSFGGLNATAESFRDEATGVRLSLDVSADRAGWSFASVDSLSTQQNFTLLRSEFANRIVAVDAAFADEVLSTLSEEGRTTEAKKSLFTEMVHRWLNENKAFLENSGAIPPGWIPDEPDLFTTDGESSSSSEVGSWSGPESTTGPAGPSLDNAFARGEDHYSDGTPYTLLEGDDVGESRLLAKLREWLRDETAAAASSSVEESEPRGRVAAAPLERVAESPAPAAGEEEPGAGMIDLAALLLPATGDEAPSVALAAASQPVDDDASASARDAALAVESWVRTLPVPSEGAGVVEGVAPPSKESAVEARNQAPREEASPQSEAARDQVSAATEKPAEEGPQTLARGSERAAERLDERQATSGPGYVAAWLTTLLGGAVVWANRRGVRHRASDCIETPRRETGRIA